MRKTIRALIFSWTVLTGWSAVSATSPDFGHAEPFKDGDTVCFVGDSITHAGTYHSMVTLFYATRFPGRKINYYNCGIGGDRASSIVSNKVYRLDVDILGHKPTVATIMLGMNDVGREFYQTGLAGPEVEQKRQAALDTYNANMVKLIDALKASGARLILITPSIYDETTKFAKANPRVAVGRDGALAKCAQKVREWSQEYHAGLVLFHEMTAAINAREQEKDPAFTLIGADRVHPGPVGHFVMAYTFLKAQGLPRNVATLRVDARSGASGELENCQIENVKAMAGGIEFDCLEKALPFVVPDDAKAALKLVPFADELNQEPLVVTGLAGGRYVLKIDDAMVGEFTAEEFNAGVNLADNPDTPQYRQSEKATRLNADRARAGVRLRDVAAMYYVVSRAKIDVSDRAAVEKYAQSQLAAAKRAKKPAPYWEGLLNDVQNPGKLAGEYDVLSAALAGSCRPQKHHFVLTKK